MQSAMIKMPTAFQMNATRNTRAGTVVVRCEKQSVISDSAKNVAVLSAAAALIMAPAADARVTLTAREKELKYQEEMLAALKTRGKSDVFGSLKSSPEVKGEAKKEATKEEVAEKYGAKSVAAPAAPAAAPAMSFSDMMSTPAPAAKPAPAAAPAAASTDAGDNKPVLAIAAVGVVALAAAAAASNNNAEEGATAAAGASSASSNGTGDVPENVASARAWIAKYKARSGKN